MHKDAHLGDTLLARQRFESDRRTLNRGIDMSLRTVLVAFLVAAACGRDVGAQEDAQNSKITTNIGGGVSAPLNPIGRFINPGANFVVGVGYNVTKRNSFIGQFMWSGLPPNREAFLPIRAIDGFGNISGSSNLFVLTGNYRYHHQWKTFGVYFIGGGGMYHREASLSRRVAVGTATACQPIWQWWGYGCVSGVVSQDETLTSTGDTVFGGNGGVGFTIRI